MIIYDCEILNAIPDDKVWYPDISYCEGWRDFPGMGISCIGLYWSHTEKFYLVEKDYVGQYNNNLSLETTLETGFDFFRQLITKDKLIVGFNSISFDDNLCKANQISVKTKIDLLCEVRIASNQPPFYHKDLSRPGYSLNAIARANNLGEKLLSGGAEAPILWQRGEREIVRQYCLHDVLLTKKIFELDAVADPTNGKILTLKKEGNYS